MLKRPFSWVNPKIEIRDTSKYGRGVFARELVKKGEMLMVMGGYICDISEENDLGKFGSDYNMDISVTHSFCPTKESDLDLMPQHLINHSCEPNAGFEDVVTIVALQDIKPDQEVVYDYAFVMWSSDESAVHFQLKCECGSPSCRKIVTENDWKIKSVQDKYGQYFQPFLRKLFDNKI
jgi:hypothetical protein